jgi:V-type H+-transporting ATPase subunit E
MSQRQALSDDQVKDHRKIVGTDRGANHVEPMNMQVAGELRKMTAFIKQEALEKAREIHIKADEEFAIEKSKLVRQETAAIDALYEKKFKQAAMSQQITRSTLSNRTRLRVLSARQQLLDDLFQRARDQLGTASKDTKKYQAILNGLILEGLYILNEDKLSVQARRKDSDVVNKAIGEAKKEFKDNVGRDITLRVDDKDPLPDGS